ncbi:MAG: TIR domain-containing protein [Turicibacter sp.]|nr:TIR domain-containing protein [Turicibacter sp.]
MILVGDNTKWNRKFIPWKIERALNRNLPIIVVYINGSWQKNNTKRPTALRDALEIHIPFKAAAVQHAFENWPSSHVGYKSKGKTGAYYYTDETYKNRGL